MKGPTHDLDDDACRRLGAIFPGPALDAHLRNAEYLESRGGGGDPSTLKALRRAKELRALDAIAAEKNAHAIEPCPECAGGKHQNCTGLVPDGDDYDNLTDCPCAVAGHQETP